jgi:hypothetical protein
VYSILDIDLDYFNQLPEPGVSLELLLNWAGRPVSMVVERHHHAFARWRTKWRTNDIVPTHILHVDEHHDMMDQRLKTNIANFMFHAMRLWFFYPSLGCLTGSDVPEMRKIKNG